MSTAFWEKGLFLLLFECRTKTERALFACRDDDKSTVMVQGVGLGGHGLDGDAVACGRGVNLDGVVLPVACILPNIESAYRTFENGSRTLRNGGFQAETVVDEVCPDFATAGKARVVEEVPGRNVGLVELAPFCRGESHDEVVNLFAEHKVRVPTFGIGHVRFPEVFDHRFHGKGFACENYFVCGTEWEGKSGKGSCPVASEFGDTFFAVGLETLESPLCILQESVECVRSPTYVVYKLVVFPLPVELCIGNAARERGEAATGVCVRAHFVDVIARPVTEQKFGGLAIGLFKGNAPGVEASTVARKDFKFSAVVALENETLHRANRPGNNRKTAHDTQDSKKVEKVPFCDIGFGGKDVVKCMKKSSSLVPCLNFFGIMIFF